jgi:hypothetical protein
MGRPRGLLGRDRAGDEGVTRRSRSSVVKTSEGSDVRHPRVTAGEAEADAHHMHSSRPERDFLPARLAQIEQVASE